jgi:hypothetical protein
MSIRISICCARIRSAAGLSGTHRGNKAVGQLAEEFAAAIAVARGREEREMEASVVDIFKERLQEQGNRMRT